MRTPPLSELQDDLLCEIAQRDGHGCEAEGVIVKRYERMAHSISKRFYYDCLDSRLDAVQEAQMACLHAVRCFKSARGVKFVTYVHRCMYTRILRYLNQKDIIRRPHNSNCEIPAIPVYSLDGFHSPIHQGVEDEYDNQLAVSDFEIESFPIRFDIGQAIQSITSPNQQIAIRMHLQGHSIGEIAKAIHTTPQNSHRLVVAAKKAIALALKDAYFS